MLLGPNGEPLSFAQPRRKIKPPLIGEITNPWNAQPTVPSRFPFENTLQFDTSRLRLDDYRMMRDHYQVNSSITVLSFMLHQMEWTVECDNIKQGRHCEENLRNIWTRLVRGLSAAFVFGFSGMALQWENEGGRVVITKVKDLRPETIEPKWKEIEGVVPRTNPKTMPRKTKIFDGIRQPGYPDVPVDNCVVPETLVLMADGQWKKAADIAPGEKIVAFDEYDGARGRGYRESTVQVNNRVTRETVTIGTDLGRDTTVSVGHPMLVRRKATRPGSRRDPVTGRMMKAPGEVRYRDMWEWVEAGDVRPGDQVGFFADPWTPESGWEAGYLAGIFDGEASLSTAGGGCQLAFNQNSGRVLDAVKRMLDARSFTYLETDRSGRGGGYSDSCTQLTLTGGRREIMRFLATVAPFRIGSKLAPGTLMDGVKMMIGKTVSLATVESVESAGTQELCSLQTSTRTLITDGYLTHNSLWYPLLMENGNYYGRKLLNAAYQPWFFSNLIHMFANRYYERFGSPTMVGRAPFGDKVDMGNGIEVPGNVLMASAMRGIRNGADVTVPNTQAQNGLDGVGNYEYTLEYLESQMRGADFERYLTRLDQEISLALFTPLLMMNTADGGSFNLGVVHTQMYLSMLNAIAADWKEYIDRYVLEPMGRHNFGYQAKPARIKFRRLGAMDQETARTILNNLMTGGNGDMAVKFDTDELGRYLGLQITEVEKLTEPSPIMEPGGGEEDPKPDPAAAGKPVSRRRDTRVGRPEREQRGKGLNKRKSVALAMAERLTAQFAKAIHDDVAAAEFTPDLGFRKQLGEAAPELDYTEFAAESEDWIRAYYEIEAGSAAPSRSEICERLRVGLEAALTRGVDDETPHAA